MNALTILPFLLSHSRRRYPLVVCRVPAGFPSPATDYLDEPVNVEEMLVVHPSSTFFMRYTERPIPSEMVNTGDVLAVDKGVRPWKGSLVVIGCQGEMRLRRWNGDERSEIEGEDWYVWGVVVGLARKMLK